MQVLKKKRFTSSHNIVLRAIDLQPFNLFDIDAFGSPWEQVWIISRRRQLNAGERIALAITSGLQGVAAARTQSLRLAGWSSQMQAAIGAATFTKHRWFVGDRFATDAAQRFVGAWFGGCHIDKWLAVRSRAGSAWYFGCVLVGS